MDLRHDFFPLEQAQTGDSVSGTSASKSISGGKRYVMDDIPLQAENLQVSVLVCFCVRAFGHLLNTVLLQTWFNDCGHWY